MTKAGLTRARVRVGDRERWFALVEGAGRYAGELDPALALDAIDQSLEPIIVDVGDATANDGVISIGLAAQTTLRYLAAERGRPVVWINAQPDRASVTAVTDDGSLRMGDLPRSIDLSAEFGAWLRASEIDLGGTSIVVSCGGEDSCNELLWDIASAVGEPAVLNVEFDYANLVVCAGALAHVHPALALGVLDHDLAASRVLLLSLRAAAAQILEIKLADGSAIQGRTTAGACSMVWQAGSGPAPVSIANTTSATVHQIDSAQSIDQIIVCVMPVPST